VAALSAARSARCSVLVSKLDRLSRDVAMQKLLLGTLILAATVATGPRSGVAQNYPWCVVNDQTGTTSCRFVSREQCLASTGGNVGHCVASPASPSLPAPVRGSRRPNG